MAQQKKPELVETFIHPTFGKCDRVDRYFAIRWKPDAGWGDKAALLQAARVELADQTDNLSWVQGLQSAPVTAESIATLDTSALVEWIAPAYRAVEMESQIFTLNPRRIYVRESALTRVGGVSGLRAAVTADPGRTSDLRGYVALTVEAPNPDGSLTAAATAAAVLEALSREGGTVAPGEVRFETILFLPPTAKKVCF
jgi:hypothetical protein